MAFLSHSPSRLEILFAFLLTAGLFVILTDDESIFCNCPTDCRVKETGIKQSNENVKPMLKQKTSVDAALSEKEETVNNKTKIRAKSPKKPLALPKMDDKDVEKPRDNKPLVQQGDSVYLFGDWDGAPVVIEKHKLVFFTSAKVACTIWKFLFRRMMGYANWKLEEYNKLLPWNPELNGLKYLYDCDLEKANHIMTDPSWTRAIFIRDPKERFVSAYLDKAVKNENYIQQKCCPYKGTCKQKAKESPKGFFEVMHYCEDAHWKPQHRRMPEKYWSSINFVGRMETLNEDAERLLRKVGAWEAYGASGWGEDGSQPIFGTSSEGRQHATHAKERMKTYLTSELEHQLDVYYAQDYTNPILNFTYTRIFDD